jgi:hypothetical protein
MRSVKALRLLIGVGGVVCVVAAGRARAGRSARAATADDNHDRGAGSTPPAIERPVIRFHWQGPQRSADDERVTNHGAVTGVPRLRSHTF